MSMFTFITLLLNGVLAGALAPFVTGSVTELALASLALVAVGLTCWAAHLRATHSAARNPGARQLR